MTTLSGFALFFILMASPISNAWAKDGERQALHMAKKKMLGWIPWIAQRHRLLEPRDSWKIEEDLGRTPREFVVIMSVYLDRRSGAVMACEVVEAPSARVGTLMSPLVTRWRFEPEPALQQQEIVEMRVALYVSKAEDGSATVEVAS